MSFLCNFTSRCRLIPLVLLTCLLPLLAGAARLFRATEFRYSSTCVNDSVFFIIPQTDDIDSVKWNFGDPASQARDSSKAMRPWHIYPQTGTYTITLRAFRNGVIETTVQTIQIVDRVIFDFGPADSTLCQGSTFTLQAPVIPGATYLWQDSSTASSILVDTSSTYKVKINGCPISDSINIFYTPIPVIDLGPDLVLCNNEQLALDATAQNCTYLWNTGNTDPVQDVRASGTYSVRIFPKGCAPIDDQITITFNGPPYPFTLGTDTLLCPGETVTIAPSAPAATAWRWSTGDRTPTIRVNSEATIWALVEINGICHVVDTMEVRFNGLRKINLGNDTTLCNGQFLLLTANFGTGKYLWQDQSDQATYYVTKPGRYYVYAKIGRCESTDTIRVDYDDSLHIRLGPDTVLCRGEKLFLYPAGGGANFKWQDSSQVRMFTVTQPGIYSLISHNSCGKASDSVVVVYRDCNCRVMLPTAFSPNGDGVNDFFRPKYRCPVTQFTLSVYNRWGERVFFSTDPQVAWTGRVYNKPVAANTYVWILDYKDGNTNRPVHETGVVTVVY